MIDTDQRLIERFLEDHPARALAIIENLETQALCEFLQTLSLEDAAKIMGRLAPYKAVAVLTNVEAAYASELVNELPHLIADTFLRKVEKSVRKKILTGVDKDAAGKLRRSLEYSMDSLGAHLDPVVLTLHKDLTVAECLERVRKSKRVQNEIFVLNRSHKLLGYTDVKTLVGSDPNFKIKEIKGECKPFLPEMPVKDTLENWDYAFSQRPVVSTEGLFLGTVSLNNLIQSKSGRENMSRSAIKAGNALGDLYLIGLSSLFGNSSDSTDFKDSSDENN